MEFLNSVFGSVEWGRGDWIALVIGLLVGSFAVGLLRGRAPASVEKVDRELDRIEKEVDDAAVEAVSERMIARMREEGMIVAYPLPLIPIILGIIAAVIGNILSENVSLEVAKERAITAINQIESALRTAKRLPASNKFNSFRSLVRGAATKEEISGIMSDVRRYAESLSR
jgi:hypothetical protein